MNREEITHALAASFILRFLQGTDVPPVIACPACASLPLDGQPRVPQVQVAVRLGRHERPLIAQVGTPGKSMKP